MSAEPSYRIPFRNLRGLHVPLRDEILAGISELLDTDAFTNGPQVEEFEHAFAGFCETERCVGVGSGLDALRLGLIATGIEPGDEVIVPANSFIATYAAIRQAGGVPVLVDASERDYNIDVEAAEAAITERTRLLLPVHLHGQMADMRALEGLAERRGLHLVEDACQAHGAVRDGVRAGASGVAAAFSFWPGKNLGAVGDAGCLVTNDAALADHVRALRDHGQVVMFEYEYQGYTARLDTVQAIVLLKKLPHLERWNEERRAIAAFYTSALAGVGDVQTLPVPEGSAPVWYLYPLVSERRARIVEELASRGIRAGRQTRQPAHLAPAFAWLDRRAGEFPLTERLAFDTLFLPLYPGLREEELESVVNAVAAAFGT
jgi:dTDP-3-amino-3,4,6-trideoxy-alpha-D-glucose transaminase